MLMITLALVTSGIMAVTAHLRCVDAAREAARLVARGDSALAQETAARVAPDGASVRITTEGDQISVEVAVTPVDMLPAVAVSGMAYAVAEPEEAE